MRDMEWIILILLALNENPATNCGMLQQSSTHCSCT